MMVDRRESERQRLQFLADRLPPSTERDIEDAQVIWWHQAALGHRLPPEVGVIVLLGTNYEYRRVEAPY